MLEESELQTKIIEYAKGRRSVGWMCGRGSRKGEVENTRS